jgi:PAS domain-containing protein
VPEEIYHTKDELGELITASNRLAQNLKKASEFANEIGEGNYNANFSPASSKDELGISLLQMREKLQKVAVEEENRAWNTEGYAKMSDLIRAAHENTEQLCDKILVALIEYVGANQGGVFLYEDDGSEKQLILKASYAYNRKKYLQKRIKIHDDYAETLIGQVYLEKKYILLTEIPDDYLSIGSGLGDAPPDNLLIIPIQTNDNRVEGVLEIASFKRFQIFEIELIEKICESLASALITTRTNEQTRLLLQESQKQSEALQQQEEEMRQNYEELQTTQEQMRKIQHELSEKEANLSGLINSTEESLIALNTEYRVIALNNVLKNRYKGTNYEGIDVGAYALDFLGPVREEWKAYYDRGLAGERFDFIKKSTVNNEDSYRHYFISPIFSADNQVIGTSVFSRDITDIMRKEETYLLLIEDMRKRIEMLEQAALSIELDNELNIHQISPALIAKMTKQDENWIGKSIDLLIPQKDLKAQIENGKTKPTSIVLNDSIPFAFSNKIALVSTAYQNAKTTDYTYFLFFEMSSN